MAGTNPVTRAGGDREHWAETVVLVLYGGACVGGATQALRSLIGDDRWNWVEMLLSGAVWAVGMLLVAGLRRVGWFPALGGREGRALLRAALATGELPCDARPSAWTPLLQTEIRELTRARWVAAAFALAVTGLVAAAAVVRGDQGIWSLAIALGGFAGVPFRVLKLRRERYEALLAQVAGG